MIKECDSEEINKTDLNYQRINDTLTRKCPDELCFLRIGLF